MAEAAFAEELLLVSQPPEQMAVDAEMASPGSPREEMPGALPTEMSATHMARMPAGSMALMLEHAVEESGMAVASLRMVVPSALNLAYA